MGKGNDMNDLEFETEMMYVISRSIGKSLQEEGWLSKEEYCQMDAILLEKYRPILGTLLAGKLLD